MQHATHTQISQIPQTCLQEIQICLTAALLDIQTFYANYSEYYFSFLRHSEVYFSS